MFVPQSATLGSTKFARTANNSGSSIYAIPTSPKVYGALVQPYMVARISEDDLTRCKDIPLAFNVVSVVPGKQISRLDDNHPYHFLKLLESFETLSLLLLGRHLHSVEYVKPAVLLSAWGWSAFLDSIGAVTSFDVSVRHYEYCAEFLPGEGLVELELLMDHREPVCLTVGLLSVPRKPMYG